jgi:hypothetical protein
MGGYQLHHFRGGRIQVNDQLMGVKPEIIGGRHLKVASDTARNRYSTTTTPLQARLTFPTKGKRLRAATQLPSR